MSDIQQQNNGKNIAPWHEKVIMSYIRKNEASVITGILGLLFCAFVTAQIYIFNHSFEWVSIEPLSPLPWIRILFSATTFVTIGTVLFALRFYQLLSFIFHKILHDHGGYVKAKAAIWLSLNLFICFYVQPIVIKFLNEIISFFYNLITLFLYVSPALGGTIVCLIAYLLVRKFFWASRS